MLTEKILFKESLVHTKYDGDTDIINKHIEHILLFDKGRAGSYKGGYQSNDITFGFQELCFFVRDHALQIADNLVFGNFWLNINKGTDFNTEHIHELNGVSAVYYHKVCCDKCPIYFKHLCPMIVENTPSFQPTSGDIVYFPSYLPHGVQGCGNPEHERITIAFNFGVSKWGLMK